MCEPYINPIYFVFPVFSFLLIIGIVFVAFKKAFESSRKNSNKQEQSIKNLALVFVLFLLIVGVAPFLIFIGFIGFIALFLYFPFTLAFILLFGVTTIEIFKR